MNELILNINTPLFEGILPMDLETMLGCIGYHIASYEKGEMLRELVDTHFKDAGDLLVL